MKEYFILADTHSFYTEMKSALDKNGFSIDNNNHIVILCGDMMDRGDESKEILDFFYNLYLNDRCILIRGNHEDLFDQMIKRKTFERNDIINGTLKTIKDLADEDETNIAYLSCNFREILSNYDKRWDELRKSMVDYFEIGNYIFVHGWIPFENDEITGRRIYDPNWRLSVNFEEARWSNGMRLADEGIIEPGKTIVCGHWHSSYGHVRREFPDAPNAVYNALEFSNIDNFEPFYSDGIIALDACTAFTKRCNCLHFTEEELFK